MDGEDKDLPSAGTPTPPKPTGICKSDRSLSIKGSPIKGVPHHCADRKRQSSGKKRKKIGKFMVTGSQCGIKERPPSRHSTECQECELYNQQLKEKDEKISVLQYELEYRDKKQLSKTEIQLQEKDEDILLLKDELLSRDNEYKELMHDYKRLCRKYNGEDGISNWHNTTISGSEEIRIELSRCHEKLEELEKERDEYLAMLLRSNEQMQRKDRELTSLKRQIKCSQMPVDVFQHHIGYTEFDRKQELHINERCSHQTVTQLRLKCKELINKLQEQRQESSGKKKQQEELESKFKDLQSCYEQLNERCLEQETILREAENTIAGHRSEKHNKDQEIADCDLKIKKLSDENLTLRVQLQELQDESCKDKQKLLLFESRFSTMQETTKALFEMREIELLTWKGNCETLKERESLLEFKNENLLKELRKTERQSDLNNGRAEKLQGQVFHQDMEIKELKDCIAKAEKCTSSIETSKLNLEKEIRWHQDANNRLLEELKTMQEREKEGRKLHAERGALKETERENEIKRQKSIVQHLEGKVKSAEKELEDMTIENNIVKKQKQEREEENHRLKIESESLSQRIRLLEKDISDLTMSKKEEQTKYDNLLFHSSQMQEQARDFERIKANLSELEHANERLKDKLGAIEQNNTRLEAERAQTRNNKLTQELSKFKTQARKLSETKADKNKQDHLVKQQEQDLESQRQEIEKLNANLLDLQCQVSRLQQKKAELVAKIKLLEKHIESTKNTKSSEVVCENDNERLRGNIQKLNVELEEMKKEKENIAKERIKESEKQKAQMQENASLQSKLEDSVAKLRHTEGLEFQCKELIEQNKKQADEIALLMYANIQLGSDKDVASKNEVKARTDRDHWKEKYNNLDRQKKLNGQLLYFEQHTKSSTEQQEEILLKQTEEIKRLESEKIPLSQEIAKIKYEFDSLRLQNENTSKKLVEAETERDRWKDTCHQLEQNSKEMKDQIYSFEQRNVFVLEQEKELQEMVQQAQSLEAENSALMEEKKKLEKQHETLCREHKKILEKEQTADSELANWKDRYFETDIVNKTMKNQLRDLEQVNRTLSEQNGLAQERLKEMKCLESANSSLLVKNNNTKEELDALHDQMRTAMSELKTLRECDKKLQKMTQQHQLLQREISALSDKNKALKIDGERLRREHKDAVENEKTAYCERDNWKEKYNEADVNNRELNQQLHDVEEQNRSLLEQNRKCSDRDHWKSKYYQLDRDNKTLKKQLQQLQQNNDSDVKQKLNEQLQDMSNQLKTFEMDRSSLRDENKGMAETLNVLRRENNCLKSDLETLNGEYSSLKKSNENERSKEYRERKQSLDQIQQLTQEKSDLLYRLNHTANRKPTEGNPAVTELSDEHRPTKLAMIYAELYDDEWTEAFDEQIDTFRKSEREVIDILRTLLEVTYDQCKVLSGTFVASHLPVDKAIRLYKIIAEECSKMNLQVDSKIDRYISKCLELCWEMSMKDPPLVLMPTPAEGSTVDTDRFRFYTQSGPLVDYVVWPTLLLRKDGPILTKGILQAKK